MRTLSLLNNFRSLWRKKYPVSSFVIERAKRVAEEEGAGFFRSLPIAALVTAIVLASNVLWAEDRTQDEKIFFDILPQRADLAIVEYAKQADVTFVFPYDEAQKKYANRVVGKYTREEAIQRLLKGTGLWPEFEQDNVLTVRLANDGKGSEMNRKNSVLAAILGFLLGSGSTDLAAQDSGETNVEVEKGKRGVLEEIVVTARRRKEGLEKVPVSIAALDNQALQQQLIFTDVDLQRAVPGLTVRQSLTQHQISFVIRGQSFDPFSSSPPAVLPYFNEVPMAPVAASTFFDLESVQVLKGPQGTLFGRNTTGGAVLFETAKPDADFGGYLTTRTAEDNLGEIEGTVSLPIVEDKILLRIAGKHKEQDGYIRNHYLNTDLGDENSSSGRITLTVKPNDSFENTTMYQYSEDKGTSVGGVLYQVNACGTPGLNSSSDCVYGPAFPLFADYLAANPERFPGGLAETASYQKELGYYDVYHNSPSYYVGRSQYITNTTTLNITDNLLLKNIAGYYEGTLYESMDVDGSTYAIFNYGPDGASTGKIDDVNQWSEELQLQGNAFEGNLDYIVGVFYSESSNSHYNPQTAFDLSPVFPPVEVYLDNERKNESKAVFLQGTYDLSEISGMDGLKATAGYRRTKEDVVLLQLPRSVFFGAPVLTDDFDEPSWQIGLEYELNDSLLFYVTHRGSWRSGGFNAFSSPASENLTAEQVGIAFKAEKVRDVEIGMKFNGDIGDVPARINIALFDQITKNMQRNLPLDLGGGPGSATVNVPEAEVSGVEVNGELRLLDQLRVGANISYIDARFTKRRGIILDTAIDFGPFADTPKWATSAFAELDLLVDSDLGDVSFRGDVYHQTKSYFSSLNDTIIPGSELPGYTLANFRLDWANIVRSNFSAAFFVTNAFDEEYLTGGLAMGALLGLNIATVGRPRTYGLEVSYRF